MMSIRCRELDGSWDFGRCGSGRSESDPTHADAADSDADGHHCTSNANATASNGRRWVEQHPDADSGPLSFLSSPAVRSKPSAGTGAGGIQASFSSRQSSTAAWPGAETSLSSTSAAIFSQSVAI
jgi:hypothetical protein